MVSAWLLRPDETFQLVSTYHSSNGDPRSSVPARGAGLECGFLECKQRVAKKIPDAMNAAGIFNENQLLERIKHGDGAAVRAHLNHQAVRSRAQERHKCKPRQSWLNLSSYPNFESLYHQPPLLEG